MALAILLVCLSVVHSIPLARIVIDSKTRLDAIFVLDAVLPEVSARHPEISITFEDQLSNDNLSTARVQLSENWTPSDESYIVQVMGSSVMITANGRLGLAYCLHDLSAHLALRVTQDKSAVSYEQALLSFTAVLREAYDIRTWSEEGQLLDLPDRSYYSDTAPFVDTELLQSECSALEGELVPALLRLGMNSITILHSDVEDYITYDALPSFRPDAPQIYNASSPHRTRAVALAGVMAPWIRHITEDFGIQVHETPSS